MLPINIMIVEDEVTIAKDIKETLQNFNYEVCGIIASGEEAVKQVSILKPDLVLMDIHLRDEMNGIEAAQKIYSDFNTPVIFLTAFSDDELLSLVKVAGSYGYLLKPFRERELKAAIEMALYKVSMEKKLEESQKIANIGRWEFDLKKKQFTWTPWLFELFELTAAENPVSYKTFLDVIHPDDRDSFNITFTDSIDNKTPFDIIHRLLMKDGRVKYVNLKCKNEAEKEGYSYHVFGIVQDITEQKQADEELAKHREHLEELIESRTNELKKRNKELESMHKVFIGREFRIKELREQVVELKKKLGEE